jgi:hypothetical protein
VGYVREKLQILGGGWNLLPPGDKTPKTDYLLAQNWRVDRTGRLVSRWGYPLKFAIPGQGYAHSAANNGGDESNYYVACNALSGTNPCSIYLNGTTLVMSGLSGYRVGFASMLGWMFIMDRNQQGRHSVAKGFHSWGIDPPTSSVTPSVGAAHAGGTTGTYQFYVTFESADQFYETGPGPVSASVITAGNDVNFANVPISPDPEVGIRNIYATGGTLGAACLVATISDNTTTTAVWNTNDLIATDEGIEMPTAHDAPPGGAGLAGPYLSRLFTWVGNRLYYTPPGQPQYWSTDPAEGDWVDVGSDGENIQWCTCHTNVLMIYKQKSIWRLVGDPSSGTLEQVEEGVGLTSPFAITPGQGGIDYFVSPSGLRVCNLDRSQLFGPEISPLFTSNIVNNGRATNPPGSILPGPNWLTDSIDAYAVALGFAMGKLYLAYGENVTAGTGSVLAVYDEQSKQWMYHRNGLLTDRFHGFLFDGVMMVGLTGSISGTAQALGYNVDDFRVFYTQDEVDPNNSARITVAYQSHFEDAGLPDNQKMWLEVVVDYVLNSGDTLDVAVGYDNATPVVIGTITGAGPRQQTSFPLGSDGVLGKNISIQLYGGLTDHAEIHNVYLYYYPEARLALAASSLPTDLGVGGVKQCKELMLDIDTSYGGGGSVTVNLYSDLPGNALAVRQTPAVSPLAGRALVKFPFPITLGYLWRVALTATTVPFRLYSVRLLARVVGTYVEAYESAAGFVWDSGPLTFESGITHIPKAYAIALAAVPIKRFRDISLEIETYGGDVTVTFLTDLPGNTLAAQFTAKVNTGTAGRRFVRLPLPAGMLAPIEGRMCQIQMSGASGYTIYDAAVEVLAVGVYVEAYEATGGAVYDSREVDFGSAKPKEARELELDIDTGGQITATVYSDLATAGNYNMAQATAQPMTLATVGRQKIKLPLTQTSAPYSYPMGRLFQVILTGQYAFRLYGAKLRIREFGTYLTGDEVGGGGVWDSTPLDFGTERLKDFRKLELDIQTDPGGTATLTIWTDQPAGQLGQQFQTTITTGGTRATVKIVLTPGIRGRLIQAEISGCGVRLFAGRVWWRAMNEPKAKWDWAPLPIEPTTPQWTWAPFSVSPTEPWFWAKCLSVVETPDTWSTIDVPFEVSGS